MLKQIKLTQIEQNLWKQIEFKQSSIGINHEAIKALLKHSFELSKSLIQRGAIPDIRLRYFSDPELNIGYKRSRKDIFEKNGTKDEDILRHPHFLQYLRYFVLGPDLPPKTISAFSKAVSDSEPVTSGDTAFFCNLAKQEVRSHGLKRKTAAEEFFKLALEFDLDVYSARMIRDTIMRLKID